MITLQHVHYCAAVARHFKIPKKIVREVGDRYFKKIGGLQEQIVLDFQDVLEDNQIKMSSWCSTKTLPVSAMLSFKKVKDSELYSVILNAFDNTDSDIVTFSSGSALMAAYFDDSYSGEGGIFLREKKSAMGLVIEPIQHYLNYRYPIEYHESETVL